MTTTPTRRWQFSLRWLLILTTILCVLLARVAYFRQRAVFHEREAASFESMMSNPRSLAADDLVPFVHAQHHRYLAYKYRRAMYRPLSVVFETPYEKSGLNDPDTQRVTSKP